MTDIDIDAIRARAEAATAGPWTTGVRWEDPCDIYWLPINSPSTNAEDPHQPGRVALIRYETCGFQYPHYEALSDAAFIANARQDVPALLAKVDELTAEVRSVTYQLTETVNDLTQSREQAATYANEIGTLKAHNSQLRTKLAERGLPDDADHWVNFNGVCEDDCPECAAIKATKAEATR